MAIRTQARARLNAVEMIAKIDDAIDDGADYDAYVKANDRNLLKFKPGLQPTVFLLNLEFSGKEAEAVKNAIVSGKDEDGSPKVALGSWSFKVAKLSLKDIINPPDVPLEAQMKMKKDDRGFAHDDLLGELDRLGIVQDIFSFYTTHVMSPARSAAKN